MSEESPEYRRVPCIAHTGLNVLNELIGNGGRIELGETVVFAAKRHHFKTGMLFKVPLWVAKYGPTSTELGHRVPMILFITNDNSVLGVMTRLYVYIYADVNDGAIGIVPDDPEDIEQYVHDYFHKAGCSICVEAYPPGTMTFANVVSIIERIEERTFKVVASIIDDANLMANATPTDGQTNRTAAMALLYEKLTSYHKASNVTLFTSHPISERASALVDGFSEADITTSSSIYRLADKVVYFNITDDAEYRQLNFKVAKVRYNIDILDKSKPRKVGSCPISITGVLDDAEYPPT